MTKLEALGQCIPLPRHVLPVPPSGESLWAADLRSFPDSSLLEDTESGFSVSPNSDESGKQFVYPDGDADRRQNLTTCLLVRCQPSWRIHANPFGSFCGKLLTDRQTNKQRRKHTLLGGGNYPPHVQIYCQVWSLKNFESNYFAVAGVRNISMKHVSMSVRSSTSKVARCHTFKLHEIFCTC